MNLSPEEIIYYDRQIILPEFNITAQEKLKDAKVLIIGAGGLGCPVAIYLASVGVGTLGIVDFDKVEITNLHRQILYRYHDVGKLKVELAADRIKERNPFVTVQSYPVKLNSDNAFDIVMSYDIIVDASDNFMTRYLVNDICVKMDKVFISGSVMKLGGSVAMFNAKLDDENRSATYRCLFPHPPSSADSPDCNASGIIGIIPGIIGNFMSIEIIKLITGIGKPLINQYLQFEMDIMNMNIFRFSREEDEVLKIKKGPLEDDEYYQAFCSSKAAATLETKEVLTPELKQMIKEHEDFYLVDVREVYEHQLINIGGASVPQSEIQTRFFEIPRDKKVVLYCKMGQRSLEALKYLQLHKGFTNLYHLKGGIRAFMNEEK